MTEVNTSSSNSSQGIFESLDLLSPSAEENFPQELPPEYSLNEANPPPGYTIMDRQTACKAIPTKSLFKPTFVVRNFLASKRSHSSFRRNWRREYNKYIGDVDIPMKYFYTLSMQREKYSPKDIKYFTAEYKYWRGVKTHRLTKAVLHDTLAPVTLASIAVVSVVAFGPALTIPLMLIF